MPQFVVLLRGVNVGKGNRVPMAAFKQLLETLGYTRVSTLLNSGNAVFASAARSSDRHARAIAAALQEKFGVVTPVIVKSATQIKAVIGGNPMVPPLTDYSKFLVAFAGDGAAVLALSPLLSLAQPPECLVITDHAAYLHCPDGLLISAVGKAMLGPSGKRVTTRNWATVLKLGALLGVS